MLCLAWFAEYGSYVPSLPSANEIIAIFSSDINFEPGKAMILCSLQGLVNANSDKKIFFFTRSEDQDFLERLQDLGFRVEWCHSLQELLIKFGDFYNGYLLCGYDENSVNAAFSLAKIYGAIVVPDDLEEWVNSLGITTRIMDLRGRNEWWVWSNYNSQLSKKLIFEIAEFPDVSTLNDMSRIPLREFAVATGSFVFYEPNDATGDSNRQAYFNGMEYESVRFGWDLSRGEDEAVGVPCSFGVFSIASDLASNLSVHCSLPNWILDKLERRIPYHKRLIDLDWVEDVHIATFIISDGDNIHFLQGHYSPMGTEIGKSEPGWDNPVRGSFPLGWTLCPTAYDLIPGILDYFFRTATCMDGFVAGFSGNGYFYPESTVYGYPANSSHASRLNNYMKKLGVNLLLVNEYDSDLTTAWSHNYLDYTADVERLLGIYWVYFFDYDANDGAIKWSNGCPIVSARCNLWQGQQDSSQVAAEINSLSHVGIPSDSSYFSYVNVHPWTKTLTDVESCMAQLASWVKVVTPEEFMLYIRLYLDTSNTLNALYTRLVNYYSFLNNTGGPFIKYSLLRMANQQLEIAQNKLTSGLYKDAFLSMRKAFKYLEKARLSSPKISLNREVSWDEGYSPLYYFEGWEIDSNSPRVELISGSSVLSEDCQLLKASFRGISGYAYFAAPKGVYVASPGYYGEALVLDSTTAPFVSESSFGAYRETGALIYKTSDFKNALLRIEGSFTAYVSPNKTDWSAVDDGAVFSKENWYLISLRNANYLKLVLNGKLTDCFFFTKEIGDISLGDVKGPIFLTPGQLSSTYDETSLIVVKFGGRGNVNNTEVKWPFTSAGGYAWSKGNISVEGSNMVIYQLVEVKDFYSNVNTLDSYNSSMLHIAEYVIRNGDLRIIYSGFKTSTDIRVEIFSINGEKLLERKFRIQGDGEFSFNTSLPTGVYIIKMRSNSSNFTEAVCIWR